MEAKNKQIKYPKVSWRKEIIQIKAEINEIENRQTREKKIMKPQASSLKRSVKLLVELIRKKREPINYRYQKWKEVHY